MTKTILKNTTALSVVTVKAGIAKIIAAMEKGEATITKAKSAVSDAVFSFLETLPPVTQSLWDGVINAVVKEAFAATGWAEMTQSVRRSELKVAAMAYSQGLLTREADQDWQAYAKAARAKLNGNGTKTNAKGQGRKARPEGAAKKVSFKAKDYSPMDHAVALGLDNGTAKALLLVIKTDMEALKAFLAECIEG